MQRLLALATVAALAALAASSTSPPSPTASAGATLAPNANLYVQGIPPVPQRLADTLAPYSDFRGHAFMDWHPQRREMLVTHRRSGGSTSQLYRVSGPLAEPQALTDLPDTVASARYEPRAGRSRS